jgi:hypothetical protein
MTDTAARQRQLIGSTAAWAANNIVLGNGEIGVEVVSGSDVRIKIGDGTLTFSALPYASASSTAINAATQAALDAKVALAGGTMTGLLVLSGNPSAALGAATKQYVDAINTSLSTSISGKLSTAGGTLTGSLTLASDPSSALQAASKQYVDTAAALKVNKAGDTMTGALVLAADPSAALEAATKQYVDGGGYQTTVGGSATYSGKVVKLNSVGIIDGSMLPVAATYLGTVSLTAAYALSGTFSTGNYYAVSTTGTVDSSWNSRLTGSPATCSAGQSIIYNGATSKWDLVGDTTSATAINGKLDKAGGTMTGALILAADPTVALGSATKQYADTMLPKAGGTMTGLVTLSADPSSALHAATKQYVDSAGTAVTSGYIAADTALSSTLTSSIAGKLPLSGGTMTGAITLSGAPSSALHAASKDYVDTSVSGFALRSNNLSDLSNAATARSNLAAAGTGVTNTFSQVQTFNGGISPGVVIKGQGGLEGGELHLEKPASGSTLAGNVFIDSYADNIRILEGGGTFRGAYLNIANCASGAGTAILTTADQQTVLLGTLTTTSGATAPLTGQNLSTYRQLYISVSNVSGTNGSARSLTLNGIVCSSSANTAASTYWGWMTVDLNSGQGLLMSQSYISPSGLLGITQGVTGLNRGSTSITFGWDATNLFDSGTILVYGLR